MICNIVGTLPSVKILESTPMVDPPKKSCFHVEVLPKSFRVEGQQFSILVLSSADLSRCTPRCSHHGQSMMPFFYLLGLTRSDRVDINWLQWEIE